jgi:glycosyltransferase involved in cell wall biosynthesis
MKIVYLGAGAAGRFCGACLHDNTLAAALLAAGQEVLLVPTYTPLRTDEANVSQSRVFFGGVNVFLQQKSALFRHTPWFLDKLLDSPGLLSWLSRRASGMEAKQLGALTISTLQGEQGKQRKELAKLIHWLESDVRPDIVHLSNSMLCGAVRELKRRLRIPIVCSLMGEDIFLEALTEPFYSQSRELLRERCAEIDAFVAMNDYFADFMADYLAVPRSRIEVIPHGLNLAGHALRRRPDTAREFVVGYFGRVAVEKGLHYLVDAFGLLHAERANLPPLKLRVAGYMSSGDRAYFEAVERRVRELGYQDRFEYVGELDRNQKIEFLHSLDVMCQPTVYHESKGISVLEALANGVPVVLPEHGAFPQMIADTGGGVLHAPEDPQALAAALKPLILNPSHAAALGRRGHQAIHERYRADEMARQTVELYQRVTRPKDLAAV